jgi:hypothetical protein
LNDPSGTGSQFASDGRYVLLIAESIVSMAPVASTRVVRIR